MARKPPPDWSAIEKVYSTGTLSNRQIAQQFGCHESSIRQRAIEFEWTRNLKADVRAATERKLLKATLKVEIPRSPANEPRAGYAPDTRKTAIAEEKALVEGASDLIAGVVIEHRRLTLRGRVIVDTLFDQLTYVIENREDIEDAIYEECKADQNGLRRSRMLAAVSLPTNAGVVKDLAGALKLLVANERQAYGLSDKIPDKAPENPAHDAETAEQLRYVHEMLTRGPMARPGGPLKVIDQPAPAANGHANGALNGKGHK